MSERCWKDLRFLLTVLLAGLVALFPAVPRPLASVPRGDRLLSIAVNPAEDGDWDAAMALAREAGMQTISLPMQWDEVEVSPGRYKNPWAGFASRFCAPYGTRVDLMFGAIDTSNKRVPAFLADRPFDDPRLIRSYCDALDWVLDQWPGVHLNSLSIGNEVDTFLGKDPAAWKAYTTFYKAVYAHVKAAHPDLPVGVKMTFDRLVGLVDPPVRRLAAELNATSDVILVTYYPLIFPDFLVKDVSVVPEDFRRLVEAYPDRPIYILEAGYPSGKLVNSSEAKQAAFIREVFRAWDKYADHIKLVNFFRLTDYPLEVGKARCEYYSMSANPRFLELFATFGLRRWPGSGSDKPAFIELKRQSAARGW